MFKFANSSIDRLGSVHRDLQLIAAKVKEWCDIDFDISHGYRSPEDQNELYKEGRNNKGQIINHKDVVTYKDGYIKKSKHNLLPAEAIDIYAYNGKKASYNIEDMSYLAGFFMSAAKQLLSENKITHGLRWGGNFDEDHDIITDEDFIDMPHFELKEIT